MCVALTHKESLPPDELGRLGDDVRRQVASATGADPALFPISSTAYLKGARAARPKLVELSGVPALRTHLMRPPGRAEGIRVRRLRRVANIKEELYRQIDAEIAHRAGRRSALDHEIAAEKALREEFTSFLEHLDQRLAVINVSNAGGLCMPDLLALLNMPESWSWLRAAVAWAASSGDEAEESRRRTAERVREERVREERVREEQRRHTERWAEHRLHDMADRHSASGRGPSKLTYAGYWLCEAAKAPNMVLGNSFVMFEIKAEAGRVEKTLNMFLPKKGPSDAENEVGALLREEDELRAMKEDVAAICERAGWTATPIAIGAASKERNMISAGEAGAVRRSEFLEAMNRLQGWFNEAGRQVKLREAEFDRDLGDTIAYAAAAPLSHEGGSIPSPVKKALEEARKIVDGAVIGWQERVGKYERNTEFRRDHGDSLLVYVYGLVKAGKSALGNFVAHGRERPDNKFVAGLPADGSGPEFFVRSVASGDPAAIDEANGELARARRFHTDVEEATDRIQGFKIPGLTWIDSPGLGSVTEANGKLAQDYVESADLVLVAMNSAQPGRRAEFDEARRLMRLDKRTMVLLTRADEIDMDVDENNRIVKMLVMKSADDRREMKGWVESQLREAVRREGRSALRMPQIATISVRYAEEHPNIDGARESGLSELFGLLREIAESEGVTMKREAPAGMFRAFVRDVVGDTQEVGIGNIVGRLDKLRQTIARSRTEHRERAREAGDRAAPEIEAMIEEEVKRHRERLDSAGLHEAVNRRAREICEKCVREAAAKMVKDIDVELRSLATKRQAQGPKLKPLTREMTKTVHERSAFGALVGTAVGGLAGYLIGGRVGAGVGAGVGGAAGDFVAGRREKTVKNTVKIGDNADDVMKELVEVKGYEARKAADEAFARWDDEVLKPLETRIDNVIDRLGEFRNKWQKEIAR